MDEAARALLERVQVFSRPWGVAPSRIRLEERAEMRSGPRARWSPLTAVQWIDAATLSFSWEARLRSAPFVTVKVVDELVDGRGRAYAGVLGRLTLAQAEGPELDRGEAQRLLASFPLCPAAFAEDERLQWSSPAPGRLRAALLTLPSRPSVEFQVDEAGRVLGCDARRPFRVGKAFVDTPWRVTCAEERDFQGLRIPTRTGAWWHLPEGAFEYYRGEVTAWRETA